MLETKSLNVIAIPFAGGDRYSYRHFQTYLGSAINWHTIELPGRGIRKKEEIPENFERMAESLITQAEPIMNRGPFGLFGHSMGALLGYHLALMLHEKNMPQPVWAFFTGFGAPGFKKKNPISHLDSDQFWNRVASQNGVPISVLNSKELRDYFEPVLRHDFTALEKYCNNFTESFVLTCPLYLRRGTEESITDMEFMAWQKFCTKPIDQQTYEGDHFTYIKNPVDLCNKINNLSENWI